MDSPDTRKRTKRPRADDGPPSEERPAPKRRPSKTNAPVVTAREALDDDGLPPEELRETRSSPNAPQAPTDPLEEFFYREDEAAEGILDFTPGDEGRGATVDEAPREFLAFQLAGEDYAVGLEQVREIVKVPNITEVPRAPQDVCGIMSLRGEVLPVFELRRRLGLPVPEGEPDRSARVVVVDVGDGPVGVLVESVDQVVRLKPSTIEPTPPGVGGSEAEFLAGIGRQKSRLFILLNLPLVLQRCTQGAREKR